MIFRRIFLSLLLVGSGLTAAATRASGGSPSPIANVWTEPDAGYGFAYAAVAGAKHSISMSLYELNDPVMEQALGAAVHRGVRVAVLLNAAYFGRSKNAAAAAVLQAAGVQVRFAPSGQIFHAKYFVIDQQSLYIGTGNFISYDYPSTRDFWVDDQRPGDVSVASAVFTSDFSSTTLGPTTKNNALVWSPGSTTAITALIASATRTLLVENQEMHSYAIEDALVASAQRGVSVTVVMTRNAKYYGALRYLAQHGVHVRLLSSGQTYIHAKVICVDCTAGSGTALVSSINFSTSSLSYNRELGVVSASPQVVQAVRTAVLIDSRQGVAYP